MNRLFFLLFHHEDKAAALGDAISAVHEGREANTPMQAVDPASFRQVPGPPFAYWVSERVRRLFTELLPFEVEGRWARIGAHGSESFSNSMTLPLARKRRAAIRGGMVAAQLYVKT